MNAITLKNRLRIAILGLVVTIVLALSILNLQSVAKETLADAEERARLVDLQLVTYLIGRIQQTENQYAGTQRNIVQGDSLLAQLLKQLSIHSGFVREILVVDHHRRILAASDPNRMGQIAPIHKPFSEVTLRPTWATLFQLLRSDEDYSTRSPAGQQFSVEVVVSSALLREALVPELRQLLVVALLSLLFSGLLAIVISDLVSGSLERISRNIERISTGESKELDEHFESAELANLQVKLSRLGKQYRGAREDVNTLRLNINQMIQRLQEAVLLFDSEGRLQTAGPPAERLLAKGRAELIGKSFDDVFPGWTQLGAAIQAAVRLNTPVVDHAVSYARNNMPDAKLLVSVESVSSSDSKPLGTLVTLRDAETRLQLESQLDISSRVASIHRLTSGVAHEIKNPLNAITLHMELARAEVRDDQPRLANELEITSAQLLRLDRVVKTFLNFSRPMDLRMAECDLTEIVRDASGLSHPQPDRPGVSVSFSSNLEKPMVLADRVLSRQAILNVFTNALESMENGGEVEIGIEKSFDDYVVNITDHGVGIPPEIGERIYNLYFTTKPNAAGIGLAETFMVMQLHNGSVGFESQVGQGTSFRLRFPAA
jgi:signal transduction histidine kinase